MSSIETLRALNPDEQIEVTDLRRQLRDLQTMKVATLSEEELEAEKDRITSRIGEIIRTAESRVSRFRPRVMQRGYMAIPLDPDRSEREAV